LLRLSERAEQFRRGDRQRLMRQEGTHVC
jgi:hypothetical protein